MSQRRTLVPSIFMGKSGLYSSNQVWLLLWRKSQKSWSLRLSTSGIPDRLSVCPRHFFHQHASWASEEMVPGPLSSGCPGRELSHHRVWGEWRAVKQNPQFSCEGRECSTWWGLWNDPQSPGFTVLRGSLFLCLHLLQLFTVCPEAKGSYSCAHMCAQAHVCAYVWMCVRP